MHIRVSEKNADAQVRESEMICVCIMKKWILTHMWIMKSKKGLCIRVFYFEQLTFSLCTCLEIWSSLFCSCKPIQNCQITCHHRTFRTVKGKWHTFKRSNFVKITFFSFLDRSTLKWKNLLPDGSKFFPFWVDPFTERDWCAGEQSGSHKSCLPCTKLR